VRAAAPRKITLARKVSAGEAVRLVRRDTHKCIAEEANVRDHRRNNDGAMAVADTRSETSDRDVASSCTQESCEREFDISGIAGLASALSPSTGNGGTPTAAAGATFYNRSNLLNFLWLFSLTVPYHDRT
jgi:hypothetical protein